MSKSKAAPHLAILGAGIFVKSQYIPRLAEIPDCITLRAIWSRSEESARGAVEVAKQHFPQVECKWGDDGLQEIIDDDSISAVAVVLAGQSQVDISLKLLKAGKHVLQEKPAAASNSEAKSALSQYNSLSASQVRPIWAIAENYRFESAFVEGRKSLADMGSMMSIQVIVEGSMNSSNPYFSSSWRRNLNGGFVLDMGVHFIAGLRLLAGCEVTSVSTLTTHVDPSLPPPDTVSSVFQLENGCSGVFVMVVSTRAPKIFWRVVCLKGTLEIERTSKDGRHGYLASLYDSNGQCKPSFHPFIGVTEELKIFAHDVSQATLKDGNVFEAEPRLSFAEGARDIAVLEAMLESSTSHGAPIHVMKV